MASSKVIGSILLARNELLRVEQLAVRTGTHLVNHSRFQIDEQCPGHMLPCSSLAKESIKSIVRDPYRSITTNKNQIEIRPECN